MEDLKTEIEQMKIQVFTGIKLGRIEEEWGNIIIKTCDRALTIHGVVGQSEQLVCSCGSIKVQTTGGSQCPNNRCSSAN